MKKPVSKHVKIAITVVISAAILYAIMMIINNIGLVYESVSSAVSFIARILTPVIIGFIFAFLLHRPAAIFARLLQKTKLFKTRPRGAGALGVLITFVLLLAFFAAFLYLLIPSIIQSISSLGIDLPKYAQNVYQWGIDMTKTPFVAQVLEFLDVQITDDNSIAALVTNSWGEITSVLQSATAAVFGFIVNTGRFLYNFVLGMVFAIYMLLFKNQIRNQINLISKAVFKKFYYKLAFTYKVADGMFFRFVAGKGLSSLAVGIITFAVCAIAGFKYAALISLIIAVTNMIPTFGPLIGAIPAVLLAMMTSPIYGLYMLIIIIAVQIIEGNILSPRILGDSLGINGFWILFSIIVMGALFGIVGMLIAAPLFGLLRILIKNWLFKRDKSYEKLEPALEYAASLERYHIWTSKKPKNKKNRSKKNAKL
ncbi:MAG: AI-2E family transporter [Clostridia bacterium]|jgi:predicted PurR-regulated permease PerM|nr:AI-2E family transporter [Clostridia bacterium]MBT7123242.1 AI-2E family transporter [Clostridia bacterium]